MAKKPIDLQPQQAKVLEESLVDKVLAGTEDEKKRDPNADLVSWVVAVTDEWRAHRKSNYEANWDRYERLWRGIWSGSEKERGSERSKFVTPALAEAVENSAAEIEEAVFGRGDFFDMRPEDRDDPSKKAALDKNKAALKEDLQKAGFTLQTSEVIINGAVFGLGIGEIVQEVRMDREIVPLQMADGSLVADVSEKEVEYSCLQSANPRNFLWDPNARNIADGLGVAFEEDVGLHTIKQGQDDGVYLDCEVEASLVEPSLDADPQVEGQATPVRTGHVLRYYGLVPEHLLLPPDQVENIFGDAPPPVEPGKAKMVEAHVVVVNKTGLLKAVENPSFFKDRPVTIFKWDIVPGRLPGRGVCEKGEVPQRMLDAEFRTRMDVLAFTNAPMMAMDATRLPRGFKFEIAPGKNLLTSGDPATVFKQFKFGELDANSAAQVQALDQMVQRATGSTSATQMAQAAAGGDARSGAVSMSLAGVVKRSKRTLLHFIDGFFMPTLEKILHRNMQFYPERYIPINSSFIPTNTIGIMQREYEMMNLGQLMQSLQPGSKEQRMLLTGVVANTGLNNRRDIIDMIKKSVETEMQAAQAQAQPAAVDPMQKQLQDVQIQLAIAEAQAKIRELNARAGLQEAKTQTEQVQPMLQSREIAMKGIYEVPAAQQKQAFEERMASADASLRAADIASNERLAAHQANSALEAERVKAQAQIATAAISARGGVDAAAATQVAPPAPGASMTDVAVANAEAAKEDAKARAQKAKVSQAAIKALGEKA